MCAYNAFPYITEAVESVLASSYVDFQFVIVNDGSTDDTTAYLKTLADSRIHLIENDRNMGIARAANVGLMHCSGEYIVRFDADDIMHPHRIERSVAFLNDHPTVGVVASKVELSEASFQQEGYQLYVDWTNNLITNEAMYSSRYRDSPIVNPSACYRSSLIEKFGNYKTDVPEDYEFWMRLWSNDVEFHKLEEVLLNWRDHSRRLTRNHKDYDDASFLKVKLEYFATEWKKVGNGRSLFHWGKNKNAARWQAGLHSYGIESKAFIDFEDGTWKGIPVHRIQSALAETNAFFLVHVRDRKGGKLIRKALEAAGFEEGVDFYFT